MSMSLFRYAHLLKGLLLLVGLAGCTSDNPEFDKPCNPGDRVCSSANASGRAVAQVCGRDPADRPVLIDEPCPVSATCGEGYCLLPAMATTCQKQADCAASLACTPLVQTTDPGAASYSLLTACVPMQPTAAAAPGAACQADAECRSYRCLQHPSGRFCLESCSGDGDCVRPKACRTFNVTIFGVMGSIRSCS